MPAASTVRTCPFCGMVTDVPHESQAACIEALQSEIARTREVLANAPQCAPARPGEDAD